MKVNDTSSKCCNIGFWIETYGCQMNKSDSDLIRSSLLEQGFLEVSNPETAQVHVYNTCSIRQHAEDRVLGVIKSRRSMCKKNGKITILAGCMAQRLKNRLVEDDIVDIVVGPYQSPSIGNILKKYLHETKNNVYLSQDLKDFSDRLPQDTSRLVSPGNWHSFVTITHGCENFCSYCIVPYVRGKLISFPASRIIDHIKDLIKRGIIEITLLGQNVNQYNSESDNLSFPALLEKVASIQGLSRLGFLTSHPKDFTERVALVIRDNQVLSRSIHLPLQSGSDSVLHAMNRGYTMKHYMKIVEIIKKHLPLHSITTDLIVGFPGETEDDFQATLSAVREIGFDEAYMYAYSPREGTPAFQLKESLSREQKIDRLRKLIELQRGIRLEKLKERIGSKDQIIVDKLSKRSNDEVIGRSMLNHPVVLQGNEGDIGRVLRVQINDIRGTTLQADRCD